MTLKYEESLSRTLYGMYIHFTHFYSFCTIYYCYNLVIPLDVPLRSLQYWNIEQPTQKELYKGLGLIWGIENVTIDFLTPPSTTSNGRRFEK